MIIHLCSHYDTFVNNAIERFKRIYNNNGCVIITNDHNTNMKMVPPEGLQLWQYNYNNPQWADIILSNSCIGVVVHGLPYYLIPDLIHIASRKPVFISFYGGEILRFIFRNINELYYPLTRKYLKHADGYKTYLKKLKTGILSITHPQKSLRNNFAKLLNAIDAFSTVTQYEYKLLADSFNLYEKKFINFKYSSIKFHEYYDQFNITTGNNILVGHSPSPFQNHLDAYHALKNYNLKGIEIISPLSYTSTMYKNKVIEEGKLLFGSKFSPLTEFLELKDYHIITHNCSSFIEFSKIQQGGSNISDFLFRGAKVYLPQENPFYKWYKSSGLKLFSIEDDLTESHLLNYKLTSEEKSNNIMLFEKLRGDVKNNPAIEEIVELFNNSAKNS